MGNEKGVFLGEWVVGHGGKWNENIYNGEGWRETERKRVMGYYDC